MFVRSVAACQLRPCPATFSTAYEHQELCPAFLRKFVCQPLSCVPLQIQTFYQNLVLVAEYHVDCTNTALTCAVTNFWCHKIDRTSK